jgi:hypothetical protein
MDGTEQKSRERLENIRSVEPILNALRTIAMGNWKAALNRREWALEFARRTGEILALIPPRGLRDPGGAAAAGKRAGPARVIALAVGSERGLRRFQPGAGRARPAIFGTGRPKGGNGAPACVRIVRRARARTDRLPG